MFIKLKPKKINVSAVHLKFQLIEEIIVFFPKCNLSKQVGLKKQLASSEFVFICQNFCIHINIYNSIIEKQTNKYPFTLFPYKIYKK